MQVLADLVYKGGLMEELMTAEQVAQYLQQSPFVIRRKLRKGEIKGVKISGKVWRIQKKDVVEYLNRGGK